MAQVQRDDDPDLLRRLAGNDPVERIRAVGELHDRLYLELFRTALGWQTTCTREHARCSDVACDVAQEAIKRFVEFVAKRPFQADGMGGPRSYLKKIAWRVFLEQANDVARADRRADNVADFDKVELEIRETGQAAWALSPDPPPPGEVVPESLVDELVAAATRALSEKDQDLLRLRAVEVPYEQIGPSLGLSPKYARKRHCEVLKRLEKSIRSLLLGYDPATRSILIRRLGLDDETGPAA